jgi:hypothetical protein
MVRIIATFLLILSTTFVVQAQNKAGWLNGIWEGTGYQLDDNSTWTMRLQVSGPEYMINYPSLKCGGWWKPIRITAWKATFREVLSFGQDQCSDNGRLVVERLGQGQIAYRYSRKGEAKVSSSAILNRKR